VLRLADVLADREVLRLELDPSGRPVAPALLLDASGPVPEMELDRLARLLRTATRVVVLAAPAARRIAAAADVVLAAPGSLLPNAVLVADPLAAAVALDEQIDASPRAAVALAWLLRQSEPNTVPDALAAESSVYSMLLAGPDFGAWLAARRAPRPSSPDERVRIRRQGNELRITLARPARRNAVDAAMRDELVAALDVARWDPELSVTIDADGPNFSAGGDLDEFGSAPDPVSAHLVRVAAGPGRVLDELRDRVTVRVHGDCVGAGVELPAFAGRVVAAPGTQFRLPEVAMGLIPGAGGTVSLPRRITRARTAWLALSGVPIDAPTALQWGLIDAIE
jgi:enoyl-CoA hydratase/carnithine racemase